MERSILVGASLFRPKARHVTRRTHDVSPYMIVILYYLDLPENICMVYDVAHVAMLPGGSRTIRMIYIIYLI